MRKQYLRWDLRGSFSEEWVRKKVLLCIGVADDIQTPYRPDLSVLRNVRITHAPLWHPVIWDFLKTSMISLEKALWRIQDGRVPEVWPMTTKNICYSRVSSRWRHLYSPRSMRPCLSPLWVVEPIQIWYTPGCAMMIDLLSVLLPTSAWRYHIIPIFWAQHARDFVFMMKSLLAQHSGDYQVTYDEILYTFSFMRVKWVCMVSCVLCSIWLCATWS